MCYRFLLTFLFVNYIFLAYSIEHLPIDANDLIHLTTDLIKGCFPESRATYLISDSSSNSLYTDFFSNVTNSVMLFNNSTDYRREEKTPVLCVAMIVSSPTEISDILVEDKWRDFNQFFIILDGGASDNGCVNAQSFLMEAWKNNILNVIFMCLDRQGIQKFYSFNPYADFAPTPWQKISVVPAINHHPWTLFSQNFSSGKTICQSISFDKAHDLNGYIVKIGVFPYPPFISYQTIDGIKIFEGYDYEVMKLLTSKLNATMIIDNDIAPAVKGFDDSVGKGLMWRVAVGRIDLAINSLFLRDTLGKGETTYPFHATGISVITQQREFRKFDGQMFAFLPLSIAALFLVTSVLIHILLRCLFQDPYSRHFVDILRVYLNLPMPAVPRATRGRLVFGAALVSFTFANIVVQSNMNTVLTSKNVAQNVETREDLERLKYEVVSQKFTVRLLKDIGIENVKVVPKNLQCSLLGKDEAFAGRDTILQTLMTETCHMPRKLIMSGIFSAYYTRRLWPIYPKINRQLLMLFESDLSNYFLKKIVQKYQVSIPQEAEQYQVISMDHMKIFFYGFAFGTFLALIAFFLELLLARL